jgi:hypothetical protein
MSKLKKLTKALSILINKPYMINRVIDDEIIHKETVLKENKTLENGFPIIDFIDVLPNFNETISPFSFLNGGSLITDLALLKGLAKQKVDCTYFEIGTWRGESVSNVSSIAKKCFSLNLSIEALKELGYNHEYLSQQEFFSKELKNVTHLKGNSFDFDFSPYHKKCDVVFVDGDHHYESVVNDTEIAFELLKDDNSVIVWHDYAKNPGEIRWDILRGIYDGTPSEKRDKLVCVSNTLCAMFTNSPTKTLNSKKITPTKVFKIDISAEEI